METFLTIREAARELEVSEDNLMSLVRREKVHAFRIGGEYIRLRKDDVSKLKDTFWTQPLDEEAPEKSFLSFLKSSSLFVLLTAVCVGLGYYVINYLL